MEGSLVPGKMVMVSGLQSRTDLNGEIGELLSYDASADRWVVFVQGESVRIRTANLTGVASVTIMPPDSDPDGVADSNLLESSGPVTVRRHGLNEKLGLPRGEIVKSVTSRNGTVTLPFRDLREYLRQVDVGSTHQEVKKSLDRGIYIGLNMAYFSSPQTQPLCCVFVGDEEWEIARSQLIRDNDVCMERLDTQRGPRPLPPDRLFSMGPYAMSARDPPCVTYFAFVKPGVNNPEAHLLPMLLTDTSYTCNAVMMYAKLSTRAGAA